VLLVLIFDFTNGFHDASNMLATLIASRAMSPTQAVVIVAFFTLLGPILGGTAVADTIGGIVNIESLPKIDALIIVLCGVAGAIAWNLVTWWLAIPSSSSHALVGGLTGVVVLSSGSQDVVWGLEALKHGHFEGVAKVLAALLISPIIGFIAGFILHRLMLFLLRGATPEVNIHLKHGQWVTASALAFSHGANDAQKGMGIITLCLFLAGYINEFSVPMWVIILSALSMTIGTMLGGWRIVRTVGFGIYKLRALHGFNTQLTSAGVIFGASLFGGPVSTTHVVSTAIMGIGASEHPRAVHWAKAKEILLTWVLTLPCAAVLSCAIYSVVHYLIYILEV
jgi:inorganic phosphate transporter, PiT family